MQDIDCLDLVDLCYRAVEHPSAWGSFVAKLARALGAEAGDFTFEDYAGGSARPFGSVGFDPGFRADYDLAFLGENPWIEELKRLPLLRSFSDALEPEDFEASAYYNEWVRPQGFRHALGALIAQDGTRAIHIGVLRKRGQGPFSREEARFFDSILPHIRRSLQLRDRLDAAGGGAGVVDSAIEGLRVPAFLVGPGRRVLGCNPAAETLLRAGLGLSVARGRLATLDHAAARALEAALDAACRAPERVAELPARTEVAIPPRGGVAAPLVADVIPLRPAGGPFPHGARCLVLVTDLGASVPDAADLLARLWGLTPSEAALAQAVAGGITLAEHAERTGITVGTARWHLKNVESKVGVNSIAAVAVRIQGALRRA
jgi:DNA-binding CsgD family transcriptional regulator